LSPAGTQVSPPDDLLMAACPRCDHAVPWTAELAGQAVICPACARPFVMPIHSAAQPASGPGDEPLPPPFVGPVGLSNTSYASDSAASALATRGARRTRTQRQRQQVLTSIGITFAATFLILILLGLFFRETGGVREDEDIDELLKCAQELLQQGKLDAGEEKVDQVLKIDPTNARAKKLKGEIGLARRIKQRLDKAKIHMKNGQLLEAADELLSIKQELKHLPTRPWTEEVRAETERLTRDLVAQLCEKVKELSDLEQYSEANRLVAKAEALEPARPEVELARATIRVADIRSHLRECTNQIKKGKLLKPADAIRGIQQQLAAARWPEQLDAEVRKLKEELEALTKQLVGQLLHKAGELYLKGQDSEARAYVQKAEDLNPSNPVVQAVISVEKSIRTAKDFLKSGELRPAADGYLSACEKLPNLGEHTLAQFFSAELERLRKMLVDRLLD